MEKIKEYIHTKRPSLSQSSLTTYGSILKSLFSKVFKDADEINLDKFEETEPVLEYLKDMPPNRRKTILSALVIITDKKPYRDLMMEDVRDYNKEINKQEKTPEQQASWVDTHQVRDKIEELKKTANFIYKKKSHNANDLQQIQNYIIMCVLGGLYCPPRRSKDFCDFKIRNIDKGKDNYLDGKKMVFNSYKTARCYGTQELEIPNALKTILNKWIKLNPTDYLLFDTNMSKLSSVKLNQRLNKIFGEKRVGVNQLFGHTIQQKSAIKNTMTEMGSSANMLDTYVKKD
ncbi:MAG: hypothetical protein EB127_02255 [Alphaproteobacteria bacterium]|nr:hypothetical protein [Alphaproteobacteria bacterium]